MTQRRKHPRVPVRARCWCEADGVTLYAKILNLSEGGVFIHTYAPLRAGSRARVRFCAGAGGGEVHADAEVVWTRDQPLDAERAPGMGLRFLNVDPPSEGRLREMVSRELKPTGS